MHHYKYSLTELDDMFPFERDIYINMLTDYLEKQNEAARQRG